MVSRKHSNEKVRLKTMPKIAFVVPVYNVERYLRECLDSILAQTYPHFKVFAINDGSKDSSGRILDEYAQQDERFIVIHKPNGGVSSARNVALDAIEKANDIEFVAFIDSDDFISPCFAECFVTELSNVNADYGVCGYQDVTTLGVAPERRRVSRRKLLNHDDIGAQYFKKEVSRTDADSSTATFLCNRVFRYSCIKSIRFNESLIACEDQDFFIRTLASLDSGVQIPVVLYFYRLRATSLSHARNNSDVDLSVYGNLFDNRFIYSKSVQLGIKAKYLRILMSAVDHKIDSNLSQSEKYLFFKKNQAKIRTMLDLPLDRSTKRRLFILCLGFSFYSLYRKWRNRRKKSKIDEQNNYFP